MAAVFLFRKQLLPRKRGDKWIYPKLRRVLTAVGLHPVEHYIMVPRHTIARWITHRPIFELCKNAETARIGATLVLVGSMPIPPTGGLGELVLAGLDENHRVFL